MVSAQFLDPINSVFPFKTWEEVTIVVAVSGGPDSVALLRGLIELAEQADAPSLANVIVAHVNHGIRGIESDGDAAFVEDLASQFKLKFQAAGAGKESEKPLPTEESMREFRYEQLLEIASKFGARYIVTGHNFDDQVETILFRIFRGTGVSGLAGIPAMRLANESITLVRPMLGIRRADVLAYLDSIGQTFRVDKSNSDSHYTRNYLRNDLIPELESRFGASLSDSIARLGQQAAELHQFTEDHCNRLRNSIVEKSIHSITLDCNKLEQQPEILVRQFLVSLWIEQAWPRQDMTFQWWSKISSVLLEAGERQQTQKQLILNLPGNIRFVREKHLASFVLQNS